MIWENPLFLIPTSHRTPTLRLIWFIYLNRLASSMKGLLSASVKSFQSAPRRLEISELCILGFSWAIFLRCPLDQTMNAFMGLLIWSKGFDPGPMACDLVEYFLKTSFKLSLKFPLTGLVRTKLINCNWVIIANWLHSLTIPFSSSIWPPGAHSRARGSFSLLIGWWAIFASLSLVRLSDISWLWKLYWRMSFN